MTTRRYSSRSQQTTLTASVTSGATIFSVVSAPTILGGASIAAGETFTIVIDPDTALEEIVYIYSASANPVSSNNLTVLRAQDGSSPQDHSAGAVVRHMVIGRDLRESNLHIEATTAYNDGIGTHVLHGIAAGEGSVVGTDKTQTLTNKTLTSPIIVNPNISGAGVDASIVFEGTTVDAFETTLVVVDPTQDNFVTIPNTSGTVVIHTAVQTLTNKTIDMTGVTLTGLSSTGMVASSATPKNYVDSILGSAVAASTSAASAATSASSAATSASSAATSASLALTSATSAATSATAAATSATSAALSATAASTSAASALTSQTAAATSAASALTSQTAAASSATTAAASVATITTSAASAATSAASSATSANSSATSATSSLVSQTAAGVSAASAAVSQTAATTSASSALVSQTAASTSAASALVSQTAATTSAASALVSQTAAATSAASALTSQTAAATSASSAVLSASSSATSATSSATSASSSAFSYTSFDNRYLGSKVSAPSVDNYGGALITGATYWNSNLNAMFVWSGSAWVQTATTSVYTMPTIGSTAIPSGATVATIAGLTLTSPTLTTPAIGVATGTSFNSITGLSATTPIVNGTAAVGTAVTVARADHIHPIDTSRAATAGTLAQFAATTSAQLAGVISDETGSGVLVFATSPTLVTPTLGVATATSVNGTTIPTSATLVVSSGALGTPSSGTLTNATGLPISTGVSGLATGVAAFLATPTAANLATAVIDETGNGALVFAGAPTLTGTVTVTGDINLSAVNAPGSIKDQLTLLLMGAL